MKLKTLIKEIPDLIVKGSKEIEITGISSNSQEIAPGFLFIAKKGRTYDGSRFIEEARQGGAVAVLTDLYDPFLPLVQLIHPEVREIEAKIASAFYDFPSDKLHLIGITGTNGKTTSSYLIRHLLEENGLSCGLIGTIEKIIGPHHFPSHMTTPDAITNHKLLSDMVGAGCQAAVMEVTSHGLDQGRVDELVFQTAVFTNLTQDHLDYHKTMELYKNTKLKLFSNLSSDSWAILNQDDPVGREFQKGTRARCLTYGIERPSDVQATHLQFNEEGTEFEVIFEGEKQLLKSSLIGRFNVYNLLAALATGLSYGLKFEACIKALQTFHHVPGRLARVPNERGLHIFVDFAHSEDALKNVLSTLKAFKKGKLITVFGCGGNRDSDKRAKMGNAVATFSDLAIVTSDNPRSEDPALIANEVLEGFAGFTPPYLQLDRRLAIKQAIETAQVGDIILIAGKGHETGQIFAYQTLPFNDYEVALQLCEER